MKRKITGGKRMITNPDPVAVVAALVAQLSSPNEEVRLEAAEQILDLATVALRQVSDPEVAPR